ncbi:hypothetical protein ACVINY_006576 [Sinorhizobium meliloti]
MDRTDEVPRIAFEPVEIDLQPVGGSAERGVENVGRQAA